MKPPRDELEAASAPFVARMRPGNTKGTIQDFYADTTN